MSGSPERQDIDVTPPFASDTPGEGVTCITADTQSRAYEMDPFGGFYGRYLDFKADGGKLYFTFSNDPSVLIDETLAGTAGDALAITTGTKKQVPWPLENGETRAFRLQKGRHRYLHVKAATGTVKLRFFPSSRNADGV